MAYKAPSVTLSEIRGGALPEISPVHRNTVLLGKVAPTVLIQNEVVVRSSPGLADNFEFAADGVVSVSAVESKVGLKDYVETDDYTVTSTGIVWTGTGSLPDDGDEYFVTYKKNRVSTEYKFFEARSVDELYLKAGFPENDIENVSIYGQVAFDVYGISNIFIQPIEPPFSQSKYIQAIANLKNRDLQTIISLSSDDDVRKALALHVKERSLAESKRERIMWTGFPTLTDPTLMQNTAAALSNEVIEFVSVTRATVDYFDFNNNAEATITVDGAGVSALIGLYRDSFDDPSFSLLRQTVPGFKLFEDDYEDYFDDEVVIAFGEAGIMQITPFRNDFSTPLIIDELTSDDTNFKTSSIAVITAKHYNTKTIRENLDENFIGRKIKNAPAYGTAIKNFLITLFAQLVKAESMASFQPGDIQVSVGVSFDGQEINPAKVFLRYSYTSIFINKQIEGTYSLLP